MCCMQGLRSRQCMGASMQRHPTHVVSPNFRLTATEAVVSTFSDPCVFRSLSKTFPFVLTRSAMTTRAAQAPSCAHPL